MATGHANGNGRRPGGGAPRIDWPAARAYYVALGPERTRRDVARRFQVSEQSVGKHARDEDWDAEAAAADDIAEERVRARAIRSLEERQADTIRVADKLRRRILQAAEDEVDVNKAVGILHRYVKLELLFAGEATDRISFEDFNAFTRELTRELESLAASGKPISREDMATVLERSATAAATGSREAA